MSSWVNFGIQIKSIQGVVVCTDWLLTCVDARAGRRRRVDRKLNPRTHLKQSQSRRYSHYFAISFALHHLSTKVYVDVHGVCAFSYVFRSAPVGTRMSVLMCVLTSNLCLVLCRHRRDRIREYYSGNYYRTPTSFVMYELAQQVNKVLTILRSYACVCVCVCVCVCYRNTTCGVPLYCCGCGIDQRRNDLLWLAIVGVTEHLIEERMDSVTYLGLMGQLQTQVRPMKVLSEW
jgi:hypothetical protein